MTTVFIGNQVVSLPSRFAEGDVLTDVPADVLNDIWLKRLGAKLRYLVEKGVVDAQSIQARADMLALEDLAPYSLIEDGEASDPIVVEAMDIARGLITARMAQEGLPVPKGIDAHARQLVAAMPAIAERARLRVEARFQAAHALVSGI